MTTTKSKYHLSDEQITFFDENGYLVLKNWIEGEQLADLQRAGQVWIDQGLTKVSNGEDMKAGDNVDYRFAKRAGGKQVFFRVDYLHQKQDNASLELLGSPQVLAVAESLCGANFVPSYESMVFKFEGDGEAIHWHQDAVFTRKHRVFNFDLYLDASKKGAGALHVLPGTQKNKQQICEMEDNYGWNPPEMIVVEMEPGDVLLHDDMVVHGSPETTGNALRRTIYLEFRSVEQIHDEGPWDDDFIQKRMQLIPMAKQAFETRYPDMDAFKWSPTHALAKPTNDSTEEILRVLHTAHSPSSFCSATSE